MLRRRQSVHEKVWSDPKYRVDHRMRQLQGSLDVFRYKSRLKRRGWKHCRRDKKLYLLHHSISKIIKHI